MKLSLFTAMISGLVACSYAIPIGSVDSMIERAYDIDDLDVREWLDLEARSFAPTSKNMRLRAHAFIDEALHKSAIEEAATPSTQTGTYHTNNEFHLDRQQPTNAQGDHKVAVQLNRGSTTTIGQVVINQHHHDITPKTVAAKLKHSINTGPPDVRVPNSSRAERTAKNIANNHAKHIAKQQRHATAHANGMAEAAAGHFKKGNK
ncbi:hypothetical protein BDZ97DRAFT_1806583 [Flammula alnicola]|nr:hypothetical protein BDZ97DRAFT_1806583 [Flammula alnicola]